MKKQVKTLESGENFDFGAHNWTKLDDDLDGGTLVIMTGILCKKAFDEDNCNDWRKSSLRKWLNRKDTDLGRVIGANERLLTGDDFNRYFLTIISDLTADDGMKDYGISKDCFALLTCDLYRKYRDIIPPVDDWYWTLTPWTCNAGNSDYVRYVNTGGALNYYHACNGYRGVRPLCRLKSEIFVSAEGAENENIESADYERGYNDGYAEAFEVLDDFIKDNMEERDKKQAQ